MRIATHRDATPSALTDPRASRLQTVDEEDDEPPSPLGGGAHVGPPPSRFRAAAGAQSLRSSPHLLRTSHLPFDANRPGRAVAERGPVLLRATAGRPGPGRLGPWRLRWMQ